VSAGTIITIALVATLVLLMGFCKRWLAMFNNRSHKPGHWAFRWLVSGLRHPDPCRSKIGEGLRNSLNVIHAPNGFIIALTYSSRSEWVKNVLAAGKCELQTRGRKYQLSSPTVVHDPSRRRFPIPVRIVLTLVGADEYMELSKT
jgi:hypothetical protein